MEVVNKLLNYDNLNIIQNTDWFSLSIDSVLLINFIKIKKNDKKIIDLCTGNAPIPMMLLKKYNEKELEITGVELQKEIYKLAKKSLKINKMDNEINLLNMDIKNLYSIYDSDTFDIITCNPPYFKVLTKKAILNDNQIKSVARHELKITLNDIFSISKKLLKNNGSIYMVHRTDRFMDVIKYMKKNNIEPKTIQFVYPKINSNSNIFLIEGRKNGNSGLKILEPLFVHDNNGNYFENIKKMFE